MVMMMMMMMMMMTCAGACLCVRRCWPIIALYHFPQPLPPLNSTACQPPQLNQPLLNPIKFLNATACRQVGDEMVEFGDTLMELYLGVFQSNQNSVHEEALLAVGALATAIEGNFQKYVPDFISWLLLGLKNYAEYEVCTIAVGVVGDVCRALEKNVLPYCNDIVGILLADLRNPYVVFFSCLFGAERWGYLGERGCGWCLSYGVLRCGLGHRSRARLACFALFFTPTSPCFPDPLLLRRLLHRDVKPAILSCFGDIALAVGGHFEDYLQVCMNVLNEASLLQLDQVRTARCFIVCARTCANGRGRRCVFSHPVDPPPFSPAFLVMLCANTRVTFTHSPAHFFLLLRPMRTGRADERGASRVPERAAGAHL